MSSSNEKWENVLSLIRQEVTDYQFTTWFQSLKPIIIGDSRMVFEFENRFILTIMRQSYYLMLKNAVMICYGKDYQIDFVPKGELPADVSEASGKAGPESGDEPVASMLNPK